MDSFQGILSAVRRVTGPMILRKIELIFYLVFPALSLISFILPSATVMNNEITCYIIGVLFLLYTIFLYLFRLKITVFFGLCFHSIVFLSLCSFIIFDFGLMVLGGVFLLIALLFGCAITVLCGLGHKVASHGRNEPPVNQAWQEPEVEYQANGDEQIEDQIMDPHWQFERAVNPRERSDDVSPAILNNDIADPQILENNCINTPKRSKDVSAEMLIDDVADPQMQDNVPVNPPERSNYASTEMLINDAADPEMKENVALHPPERLKDASTERLINDVADPQIQASDNLNPDIQSN